MLCKFNAFVEEFVGCPLWIFIPLLQIRAKVVKNHFPIFTRQDGIRRSQAYYTRLSFFKRLNNLTISCFKIHKKMLNLDKIG